MLNPKWFSPALPKPVTVAFVLYRPAPPIAYGDSIPVGSPNTRLPERWNVEVPREILGSKLVVRGLCSDSDRRQLGLVSEYDSYVVAGVSGIPEVSSWKRDPAGCANLEWVVPLRARRPSCGEHRSRCQKS